MNRFLTHYAAWVGPLAAAIFAGGCEIGTEPLPASPDKPAATQTVDTPQDVQPPRPTVRPLVGVAPKRVTRGKLEFIEGYAKGYAEAVLKRKPMLVFFTAGWCHFCHQMANEAFTHPQVVRLSKQFVCILVDADREPGVCKQFKVTGYPTIQFVSARGVPLQRLVGKKPGQQVMAAMQGALHNVARRDPAKDDLPTQ